MIVETFGFLNLFGCVLQVFSLFPVSDSVLSDFFPVVVTFLRQLPFIGTALSLPYVREVSSQAYYCPKAKFDPPCLTGRRSSCWLTNFCSITIHNMKFDSHFVPCSYSQYTCQVPPTDRPSSLVDVITARLVTIINFCCPFDLGLLNVPEPKTSFERLIYNQTTVL